MGVTLGRSRSDPVATIVFDSYWLFAKRRQDIFFARLSGSEAPWTEDVILRQHRFTNAYRVLDRVTQHLVRDVIRHGEPTLEELFFRTVLFKLFNKIETWTLLCSELGTVPSWCGFDYHVLDEALTAALDRGQRVYSAAYIMPVASRFGGGRKHRSHLRLLEWMMVNRVPYRVAEAPSMAEAFKVLRSVHSIGDFLAYQLVTDLNYSDVCDFDEMDFVMPGPGARDGLAKCFTSLGDYSESEVIRWVAETQEEQFAARGLDFQDLWGRPLQLIDCQSLFCEVGKYARLAHPEIAGSAGRTRIKQRFQPRGLLPAPVVPAKWGLTTQAITGAESPRAPRGAPIHASARGRYSTVAL
jgi:hypothetical protein